MPKPKQWLFPVVSLLMSAVWILALVSQGTIEARAAPLVAPDSSIGLQPAPLLQACDNLK